MAERQKKFLLFGGLLVFIFFLIELSCFIFFYLFKDRFSFFNLESMLLEKEKLVRAERVYDFELGWKKKFNTPFGERPRAEEYAEPLLATFGDSYTYCDQVRFNQTFQTYLSERLKADVYNFGVGGFGTDQAYLRFLEDYPRVKTPIVALGLITENINRIVNVYRNFYHSKTALSLPKPRFVLEGGNLKLIENPLKRRQDLVRLRDIDFVRSLGRYDWWYNHDDSPVFEFPYSAILLNKRLWLEAIYGRGSVAIDDIDPRPWENLWQVPPARDLMFAILDSFVRESRRMGAKPLIIISPRKREVIEKFRGSSPENLNILLNFCRQRQYSCFNGVEAIAAKLNSEQDISSYFYGHLTPQGNLLFARKLFRYLVEEKIVEGYRIR